MTSISPAFVACLCAVLVSLAQASVQNIQTERSGPLSDIRKLLDANLELWVYNSTEDTKGQPLCRYDENYNTSGNSTSFIRYSGNTTRVDKTLLNGNFLNWNDNDTVVFDALELYKTDAGQEMEPFHSYEVYEYAGEDQQCAVVSVLKFGLSMEPTDTAMIHELRLNRTALNTPKADTKCWETFNFLLKDLNRTTKSYYSDNCKTLLQKHLS
uniref:Lipocalin/cytosolic fatty-acid binding domain-containing protein n=1 Tax=Amblyomma maculatum TaxID=34609 RepID=G3MNK8_AMBMU